MGKIRVRYLVARRRKSGEAYYWVPTPALQKAGFSLRRLADDKAEAVKQAEEFNAKLDRWYREGTPPPLHPEGSLAAINELFQLDDEFKSMRPRTQQDYLRCIRPALDWAGDMPAAAITRKALKIWYRERRDSSGLANSRNWFAALRRLLGFAHSEDWIPDNPALKMKIATPASRERVWSDSERSSFVAAAIAAGRPSMATAVMLGWCLGQRPADLRQLVWTAYDGKTIELRQQKTGRSMRIPVLIELRQLLESLPRTSTQIVVNETTKCPYKESAFQHLFAEIRQKAGLPSDLQYRDLRRTLATALGAAGCTDDQIRAITGHKTRAVVAIYVRPDDTYAKGAMRKLAAATRAQKLNAS